MLRPLPVLACWALSATAGQALSAGVREGLAERETPNHLETVLVVPELKFLFCYIPKNACTQFNKLIDDMNKILPVDHWQHQMSSATRVFGWSEADVKERLRDKSWTKAVFLRDPLERLASAWRNKCRSGAEECKTPGACRNCIDRDFGAAVGKLDSTDDEHWIKQVRFGGGLPDTIGDYDFVGYLSKNFSDVHDQVVKMLHLVLKRGSREARVTTFEAAVHNCSGIADQDLCVATWLADRHLTPWEESDWQESFFEGFRGSPQPGLAAAAGGGTGPKGDPVDEYFPADHSSAPYPTGTASGEHIFRPGILDLALRYYREDYERLPGLSTPQWALDMSDPWWFENATGM